jgi:hypothetical protein
MAHDLTNVPLSFGSHRGFRWELPEARVVVGIETTVLRQVASDYAARGRLAWGLLLGTVGWEGRSGGQLVINDSIELDGAPGNFEPLERLIAQTVQESGTFPAAGIYLRPESGEPRVITDLILAIIGYLRAPLATLIVLRPEDCGTVTAEVHLRIAGESLQNIHKTATSLPEVPPAPKTSPGSKHATPPAATITPSGIGGPQHIEREPTERGAAPRRSNSVPPQSVQDVPAVPPSVPHASRTFAPGVPWWQQPPALIGAATLVVLAFVFLSSQPGGRVQSAGSSVPAGESRNALTSAGQAGAQKLDVYVSRKGTDLEVTWNPASPAIRVATRGFLFINDGGERTQVFLEESHLQTGRLLYVPRTNDVDVRLEIMLSGGQIVRESLRVLGAGSRALDTRNRIAVPQAQETRFESREQNTAARQVAPAAPTASDPPVASPSTASGLNRSFSPAAQPAYPVGSARIEGPPDLAIGGMQDAKPVPEPVLLRSLPSYRNDSPAAPKPTTPSPRESERTTSAAPEATITAANSSSTTSPLIAPAVPVQKVNINLPGTVRAMLQREVTIEVKVRIDETGRVIKADSVRQSSPLHIHLARLAENTAYMWRFSPAREGNRSIASDYLIIFKFRK